MDRPHYDFKYSVPSEVYSFVSKGRNGCIKKKVQFDLIGDNIFNLGFGDWKDDNQGFDDLVITDNGDMDMVLSTFIRIMVKFLSMNPTATLYLTGSTSARTRLYRIIISNHYEAISNDFMVWGYLHGRMHAFEKNINYEAFLISKLL